MMPTFSRFAPAVLTFCVSFFCYGNTCVVAQSVPEPMPPTIAKASGEGELAISGFEIPAGIEGQLFAAEPLFANPVAFFVDDRGRVFVCESFRQGTGVVDNRSYGKQWVDADLAAQTVEDRRKYHWEQLGDRVASFMEQDDQIRLLIDTDHDGTADESHVFANRFNGLVDGTGAGVLEYNGNVYYTCIPSLYVMRDENGDYRADGREALYTGFGVRVAFRGHDLHGLVIGPDGRLYFSIGDRGSNVVAPSGDLINTESGSVFRCELDGSNLEMFATGLRNPQELAFDDWGNLFTGDNNSDSGDQARWVYVVEGGDSGWRMAYQYLSDRGPFNRERIWQPLHEGQPAYIVPPIANFADGPSGLDYYPGTGFGEDFKNQFFLADFRGTASQSGIRSIRNEPVGAFFKIAEDQRPFWKILATDVQFGPDGAVYLSDWVDGWEGEGKGRIYRFYSPEHQSDPIVAEVQRILATNLAEAETASLASYLRHADRRVRMKAQLELAARGELQTLVAAAKTGASLLERLHGIWGLDHLSRRRPNLRNEIQGTLISMVEDAEAEVRAQVTRLLGELGGAGATQAVRNRLTDESARVRYCALTSARKLAIRDAFDMVVNELAMHAEKDPVLRHGGAMALTAVGSETQIQQLRTHPSKQVRLGAIVALRRLGSPALTAFLDDEHEQVVAEAACAIHDVPIESAFPQFAALIGRPFDNENITRRVLNANFRLGGPSQAAAVARFAADPKGSLAMRREALEMLADWEVPDGRDRVLGMWRPLEPRASQIPKNALEPVVERFAAADPSLRLAVGRLAAALKLPNAAPVLRTLLKDREWNASDRAQALVSLHELGAAEEADIVDALSDPSVEVRAAALGVFTKAFPTAATDPLVRAAIHGETLERQVSINALAQLPEVNQGLLQILESWANGELPAEIQLEALLAAEAHQEDARVATMLGRVNATRDPGLPLDQYREALYGGDASRGRTLFWDRVSLSCVRCHKVADRGGEVGPELTRIAADKDREYLLEAIVDPNKVIAKGFQAAILLDLDGRIHTGVVRDESDTSLTLIDLEGKVKTFDKAEIEARNPSKSAMPDDLIKYLTKAELRDLVEYLSTLDGRFRSRRQRVQ